MRAMRFARRRGGLAFDKEKGRHPTRGVCSGETSNLPHLVQFHHGQPGASTASSCEYQDWNNNRAFDIRFDRSNADALDIQPSHADETRL